MDEWDLPTIGLRRLGAVDIAAFWKGYAAHARPGLLHASLYSRWRPVAEDLVISLYITNRSVGMFVRGRRGETHATTLRRLSAFDPALGEALGSPLRHPVACCHLVDHRIATTDPAAWGEAFGWLSEREAGYHRVLSDLTRG
ncbi:MAG: hypothetical protein KF914_10960 [Rhizobiaceae bacterium]|nr:hypothetical protein [Rhizobiaceae bacterium]